MLNSSMYSCIQKRLDCLSIQFCFLIAQNYFQQKVIQVKLLIGQKHSIKQTKYHCFQLAKNAYLGCHQTMLEREMNGKRNQIHVQMAGTLKQNVFRFQYFLNMVCYPFLSLCHQYEIFIFRDSCSGFYVAAAHQSPSLATFYVVVCITCTCESDTHDSSIVQALHSTQR